MLCNLDQVIRHLKDKGSLSTLNLMENNADIARIDALRFLVQLNFQTDNTNIYFTLTNNFSRELSDNSNKAGLVSENPRNFNNNNNSNNNHNKNNSINNNSNSNKKNNSNSNNNSNKNGNDPNNSNIKCVIIGDSLLRHSWRYLDKNTTRVLCVPGLNQTSFGKIINKLPVNKLVTKVIVHVGTNDLNKTKDVDYFIGNYWNSMIDLKIKFPNAKVSLSGVLKRKDMNYSFIRLINYNLSWMAKCFGFDFCNPNYVISYYHLDRSGLHLNWRGKTVFGHFLERCCSDQKLII